jgi:hypothetical protein
MKIQPWMWIAGAIGVVWWMNRPQGATIAATGTAAGAGAQPAGGFDAGRHGGGGHHHGGGPRIVRGPVGPSWTFAGVDYAGCVCDRYVDQNGNVRVFT